eukprot:2898227-Alexandrium_andersonii.AAC.1
MVAPSTVGDKGGAGGAAVARQKAGEDPEEERAADGQHVARAQVRCSGAGGGLRRRRGPAVAAGGGRRSSIGVIAIAIAGRDWALRTRPI